MPFHTCRNIECNAKTNNAEAPCISAMHSRDTSFKYASTFQ